MEEDQLNTGAKLNIQNLSLAYGKTEVLKGVNLSIEPGEFSLFWDLRAQESPPF